MKDLGKLLIDGEWIAGADTFPVKDKYSGRIVAEVTRASKAQADAAVAAARRAFETEFIEYYQRYEILMATADLIAAREAEIVDVMMAETGFTRSDCKGDFIRCLQTLKISAEEAKRIVGEMIPISAHPGQTTGRLAFTMRMPVGVVCAITPFNSPLNTVSHKIAPSFAAGNATVLKPAEQAPLCSAILAQAMMDAGLPKGWLNIVNGFGEDTGEALLDNQDVDYYTFTGSTAVGKHIQSKAGLRRTQMELGNISATAVMADADLKHAAAKIANAGFRKAGQVCTSVQRVYVETPALGAFVAELKTAAEALVVGDPHDEKTHIGPMIDEAEAGRAEAWVKEAVAAGATLVCGGTREGPVFRPTILTGATADMRVVCNEIFAPVVTVLPIESFEAAVEAINATPYGLAAGLFTNDVNNALKASRQIRVGLLNINDTSSNRVDLMPYGGVKESGFGKEGPKYAIHDMTEERLITILPTV